MIWADLINILGLIVVGAAAIRIATNANTQGLVGAFFKGFNGAINAETG
jgi:uncharacterized protein YdbL (DUF1318 family)